MVDLMNHFGGDFEHTLIALDGDTSAAERIEDPVMVKFVRPPKTRYPLEMAWRLARLIGNIRPDLLLTYNWGSIEAICANEIGSRLPLIHTEDGFGHDEAETQKRRRVWARRLLLRSARQVIAPSHLLVRIMTGAWKLAPWKVSYVPNGIDTSRFTQVLARPAETDEAVTIGTVGHLRPEKRQQLLIEACAEIALSQNIKVVIAGEGSERPRLEKAVATAGLGAYVTFTGYRPDIEQIYQNLDIFALTSSTEQMPLSVLEAMSCGLPVVSTNVGDVAEMVSPENRPFIVCNERKLVPALSRLVVDPALRRMIGVANREWCVRHYSSEQMFKRYAEIYHSAIRQ